MDEKHHEKIMSLFDYIKNDLSLETRKQKSKSVLLMQLEKQIDPLSWVFRSGF